MFIKLHSRFQFSRSKVYVSCLSCLCDSFKPHCQSTRLFFMTVSVLFFPACHMLPPLSPSKKGLLYSPKERIKKISVPILIACRSRLIHIAALLLTPLPPPKKMATSRHLLCTAAMAASLSSPLKRISTDGKKMAGT